MVGVQEHLRDDEPERQGIEDGRRKRQPAEALQKIAPVEVVPGVENREERHGGDERRGGLEVDGGGPKGDVLTVAELAGVMGGKRTAELIPLCHPLPLTDLVVAVTPDRAAGVLRVRAEAATTARTGVEMEAMTAASIGALTVYDMVKGVERDVEIRAVRLVSKTGGKSGDWVRARDAAMGPTAGPRRRPGERTAGRIGKRPRG